MTTLYMHIGLVKILKNFGMHGILISPKKITSQVPFPDCTSNADIASESATYFNKVYDQAINGEIIIDACMRDEPIEEIMIILSVHS
jgi:hypothetical protein